jgi:hypothetical protein
MSEYFFVRMDEFTAHPERYEEFQFQTAAQAVDVALRKTMNYMEEEQAGRLPIATKEELSSLWQAASRAVAPLDSVFSEACYYKALGWLRPEDWVRANEGGIKTDLEFIKGERIKLIKSAKVQPVVKPTSNLGQWITDKEHRERWPFGGGGLAVIFGALWTAFVYFDGKTWINTFFTKETTQNVREAKAALPPAPSPVPAPTTPILSPAPSPAPAPRPPRVVKKICFGNGHDGEDCRSEADATLDCGVYKRAGANIREFVKSEYCPNQPATVEVIVNHGKGECGWTAFRVTCNP